METLGSMHVASLWRDRARRVSAMVPKRVPARHLDFPPVVGLGLDHGVSFPAELIRSWRYELQLSPVK